MTVLSQVRLMASMSINPHGSILTKFLGLPSTSQAAQYPVLKSDYAVLKELRGTVRCHSQTTLLPPSPPTAPRPHTQSLGGLACLKALAKSLAQTPLLRGSLQDCTGLPPDTPRTACLGQGEHMGALVLGKGDSRTWASPHV